MYAKCGPCEIKYMMAELEVGQLSTKVSLHGRVLVTTRLFTAYIKTTQRWSEALPLRGLSFAVLYVSSKQAYSAEYTRRRCINSQRRL
ncbi:hypothetical protein EVAR_68423_1 [Eumeta japonica]|uniref:Uncharacterized protein n=1 Tax=Eumeta variegata TaxID=151549 RepID=A0A4C1ZQB5_EUMVA|nr:hypothetical protein EVAR_68423_1 [Eumeta japonica]